jgi:hypothetical protein
LIRHIILVVIALVCTVPQGTKPMSDQRCYEPSSMPDKQDKDYR